MMNAYAPSVIPNLSSGTEDFICIDQLSVRYGAHVALSGIDLRIAAGDFAIIIGPNGGGKTTLLKAILGLVAIDAGSITINGDPVGTGHPSLSYVPQHSSINAHFPINVQQVILQGRLPAGHKPVHRFHAHDYHLAEMYMDKLGLTDLARRQIGRLSGGQLQRVLIARALVRQAALLLLDEPTANLDAPSSEQVFQLLHEVNREVTILMVSHDTRPLHSVARHVIAINRKLHYQGTPDLNPELLMELYTGYPGSP